MTTITTAPPLVAVAPLDVERTLRALDAVLARAGTLPAHRKALEELRETLRAARAAGRAGGER